MVTYVTRVMNEWKWKSIGLTSLIVRKKRKEKKNRDEKYDLLSKYRLTYVLYTYTYRRD